MILEAQAVLDAALAYMDSYAGASTAKVHEARNQLAEAVAVYRASLDAASKDAP